MVRLRHWVSCTNWYSSSHSTGSTGSTRFWLCTPTFTGSTRTNFKRSTGFFWLGKPVTSLEASFRKCKRVIFTCSACATSTRSTPFYTFNTLYTFYRGFYCILILINMVFVAIFIFVPTVSKRELYCHIVSQRSIVLYKHPSLRGHSLLCLNS